MDVWHGRFSNPNLVYLMEINYHNGLDLYKTTKESSDHLTPFGSDGHHQLMVPQ